MITSAASITVNNGVQMPALGLGVFQSPPAETIGAVEAAIATGNRLVDTAAAYGNEREVGEAIRRSGTDRDDIATQAWSPLGGIKRYRPADASNVENTLEHTTIVELAAKYGKTPTQAVLRWHIEHGVSAIPKSVKPHRIKENFGVFDFTLTPVEIVAID